MEAKEEIENPTAEQRKRKAASLRYHKGMKRTLSLFLLLPLALLSSCTTTSKRVPLARNGDISSASVDSYDGVCIAESASRLIERVNQGESVAFLFTSTSCSHCIAWEPTFVSFLKQENYEVTLFHNGVLSVNEYNQAVSLLQNYYHDSTQIDGSTPKLFIADQSSFTYIGAANLTLQTLHNGFRAQADEGHITTFRSVEAYQSFLGDNSDTLTYLYDSTAGSIGSSFYVNTLFPKAKSASKSLALLDFEAMDDENKAAALALYGLTSFAPILQENSSVFDLTKESEMAKATSLVEAYYR